VTRAFAPKLSAYAGLAALGLVAALATRLPELVVLAAPFAVLPVIGLVTAKPPRVAMSAALDRERAIEGDEVEVVVELSAARGAPRLDVLLELPRLLALVGGDDPVALRLGDGAARPLPFQVRCDRWGAYVVGRVFARAHGPLGFVTWAWQLDDPQPLKVYPTEEAVRALLRPLETQVFSGNHVARPRGEGIEFADLRQFVPGDRLRNVNWRASARRAELWVNQQHPERNADVVLFLDTFTEASHDGRSTLDLALRAASSLVARYLRQKDRVGFVTFGGMLNWLLPSTGTAQMYRIVDSLLDTRIVLNYAWRDIEILPRRTLPPKAIVLALTPLLDDRAVTALLDLRARGFDLVVVEISPEPFLAPPSGDVQVVARRLWRLRREALRGRFERAGVPVATWDDDTRGLAVALEEVTSFRRHARLVRV
jgi:uncharacterized protein (DUF58 family)